MNPMLDGSSCFSLDQLGWSPFFEQQRVALDEPVEPARVAAGSTGIHHLLTTRGALRATVSGRLLHEAAGPVGLPAVGDWVGLKPGADGRIVHRFERRTCLLRKGAGRRSEAQVLAANVDTVMVVTSLNADFNPRRLERFLSVVLESGAQPVFVLNKADLCDTPERFREAVRALSATAPIALVSALEGGGLDALREHLRAGETLALVGSSGVGKSTIANRLLGEAALREGGIRDHDDRGRHTTTHRELFVLPSGGLLIDTPGLRELESWSVGEGGPAGFSDIAALADDCRFRDCSHNGEPGCAVGRALRDGTLEEGRLAGFRKLEAEARLLREKQDARARTESKRRPKTPPRPLRRPSKP